MIAVDTNLLVYAHRKDSEWHEPALAALIELAESGQPWGIPWPCVHEFLSIVTHPRIYEPPSTMDVASRAIEAWRLSPSLVFLHEGMDHWSCLSQLLRKGKIKGPMVHDARIATICLSHGVKRLWTADRDFSRFGGLKTFNPLL